MADYIEVNMEILEQDTSDMEEKLESIKREMGSMFESIAELDTMWDGPASDEFKRQFSADSQAFEEICKAVDGMLDGIRNAIKSYNECETTIGDEINRINV